MRIGEKTSDKQNTVANPTKHVTKHIRCDKQHLPSKDDVEAPALSDVGAESMGECLFQNAAVTAKWTHSCRLRE